MATYVNDLRLKEIATGDESGTWGTSTNTNLELVAEAFSFGTEAITTNADTHTTTIADGATDPGRSIYLQYTGTLDSTCTVTIGPNTVSKLWFIENATSGSQDIIIKQGSGATVTIRNGDVKAIYSDGAGSGGAMVDAFTDLHVNGLTSEVDGNTAALTVRSTDADANLGPLIVFDRESGSPADGDLVGRLLFQGENDAAEDTTYARIHAGIVDASDGTEDGLFQIASMLNGTVVNRMEANATETVFNEGSKDLDFRVETDTDANALFVQGSSNRIGIGDSAPSTKLHVTTSDADDGITIECTNAGASAGPSLKLDRGSSSPADDDDIGEIEFNGRNDASELVSYSRINSTILDASDGTEDGSINLTAMLAGTLRSRFFSNSTETVINEGSVNLDFRVESDGSTNMLFVDGENNKVLIGTNTPVEAYANAAFQVSGTTNAPSTISIGRFSDNANSPVLNFIKSRDASIGGNTIVASGDNLGSILFSGNDGVDGGNNAARILGEVDGTPGSDDMPGRLVFHTTPDGSTTLTEALRINDEGHILINTTTDYGGTINIARATNDEVAYFVSTDADSSTGPVVTLLRASASPADNDVAGRLSFSAYNSAGADTRFGKIQLVLTDVTDGTEDGRLEFEVMEAGAERSGMTLSASGAVFNEDSRSEFDFRVESDSSTHCLFVNAGTDKVGIKTSDPDGQLHIHTASAGTVTAGSVADELVLENSASVGMAFLCPNDGTASLHFGDPDDNNVGMIQYDHSANNLLFTVAATERMRIDSNGCVMINRTTAVADDMTAAALHVGVNATSTSPTMIVDDGDASVEADSIVMAVMFSNDNSFSEAKYISFRDLGGEQGTVTGTGNGSVSFNTSSDVRLKTNIQDTASQWDTIKALQVRDYEWIGNGNEETGFIAQELHEQIPQVVRVGGEEAAKQPWAVDYGRITPQLTKALQEAMARIETLETELAKLKGGS